MKILGMASSIGKLQQSAPSISAAPQQTTTFPLMELNEPDFTNKYQLGPAMGRGGYGIVYGAIRIDDAFLGITTYKYFTWFSHSNFGELFPKCIVQVFADSTTFLFAYADLIK